MNSKVLITGATGFIGKYLISTCHTQGILYLIFQERLLGKYSLNQYGEFDTIIHLAGCAHKEFSEQEYIEVNYKATKNLAEQAVRLGVKRFIYISTLAVHGDEGKNITSDSPILPNSMAAKTKCQAEEAIKNICDSTSMDFVIIRPPLVYGPGVKANFAAMMKWVYKGIPLPLGGITENKRSLVSVDNLVDLIMTCIEHPNAANQTFLVSDDEDVSTTGLLKNMAKALNVPSRLIPVPASWIEMFANMIGKNAISQRLCGSLQVDISKTKNTLNWKPPYSSAVCMKKTAEAFIKTLNK
jgi:nucleoside-diphosphate-sugar epimerase